MSYDDFTDPENDPNDLVWSWVPDKKPDILKHLQRMACHMVLTGLLHPKDEDKRLDLLDYFMINQDWQFTDEEMDTYLTFECIEKTFKYIYRK